MTVVQKSALVKYSARQMFDLVNDIEAYPQFLPWCSGSRILTREDNYLEAELMIAKGGFKKSFSTRNKVDSGGKITVSLLDGPFSYLEGVWNFMPLREDASKITLDLEFEMSGKRPVWRLGRYSTKSAIPWSALLPPAPNKFMPETLIDIEVVYATAAQQALVAIKLNEGCTAADAIAASGLLSRFPEISAAELDIGVFAQVCDPEQALKQGDRVEIYRPLRHDPKEARRQRANKK